MTSRAVVVTGASGFIGSACCDALAAHGFGVRPVGRVIAAADFARPLHSVVHCAPSDPADIRARAIAAGAAQFVLISSMAAHAAATSQYGRDKWKWERACHAPTDLIVKPGTVIGDGGIVRQLQRTVMQVRPDVRGGALRQNARARAGTETVHVDQHIDLAGANGLRHRVIVERVDTDHFIKRFAQTRTMGGAVFRAEVESRDVHARAIMRFKQLRHQQPDRVSAQITRQIADAQSIVT